MMCLSNFNVSNETLHSNLTIQTSQYPDDCELHDKTEYCLWAGKTLVLNEF